MSATARLTAVQTSSTPGNLAKSDFESFKSAYQHAPWNLRVELLANAVGMPAGRALLDDGASVLAGSLAAHEGHQNVKAFVCAAKNGLGANWSEFHQQVVAYSHVQRYALSPDSVDSALAMVDRVNRSLNRPAENAAEFHRVIFNQLTHEREVEKAHRLRSVKRITQERNVWQQKAEQADAEHEKATLTMRNSLQRFDLLTESLKEELGQVKATKAQLQSKSSLLNKELEQAKATCDELKIVVNEALGAKTGDFYEMRAELRGLKVSLKRAQSAEKQIKRQYREIALKQRRLTDLCKRREQSLKNATKAIQQVRGDALAHKNRAGKYLFAVKLMSAGLVLLPVLASMF